MIKIVGQDRYLSVGKKDGRIRNGSPAIWRKNQSWVCLWFWNGRRLRHVSGRWLRVADNNKLVIQKKWGGRKSVFQFVGPDESPLENFPGIEFIPEDLLWEDEEPTEEDEQLPQDIIDDDAAFDAGENEDDDSEEDPVQPIDDDDEDDVEVESGDLEFDDDDEEDADVDIDDADDVDEDDGIEFDTSDLPFEADQGSFIVQPTDDSQIPEGNCCNPVSRSKQAAPFTASSLSVFTQAYTSQIGKGNSFIYTHISQTFVSYPDEMNPIKVFKLGNEAPEDNTMTQLLRHFTTAQNLAQTEAPNQKKQARRFLRKVVRNMEDQLEIIDFAVEMLRAAGDSKLDQFERNQKVMHRNVRSFYGAMRPHRFAYKVYSKVPVSQGTVATLQENMLAKLTTSNQALDGLNALGLNWRGNNSRQILRNRINRITRNGRYSSLRRVLRVARHIMVQVNKRAIQSNLSTNPVFLPAYHNLADSLFRANDSRSVRCLAIWALKRRHIHPHKFEEKILEGGVGNKWSGSNADDVRAQIALLKAGETESAVDHLERQRNDVNAYIDAVFRTTLEYGQ